MALFVVERDFQKLNILFLAGRLRAQQAAPTLARASAVGNGILHLVREIPIEMVQLFGAQGDYRIDAGGAARGDVAGEERDGDQCD